jgi:hypothetical protein
VYLAHVPERIDPGNGEWPVERLPRVVGAVTAEGREVADAFYREFLDAEVHIVGSPGVAEAAKIIENAFRDINIAFVNEIALSLEGLRDRRDGDACRRRHQAVRVHAIRTGCRRRRSVHSGRPAPAH